MVNYINNTRLADSHPAITNNDSDQADTNNWIRGNKSNNQYRYFNTYPRLHQSPICTNTSKPHTLNIGHLNIHSLTKHYDELCLLPLQQFDIMCFSETWLNQNHSNQSVELTFFGDPFRHDRDCNNKSRGGITAIYCKTGQNCTQLTHLEDLFSE